MLYFPFCARGNVFASAPRTGFGRIFKVRFIHNFPENQDFSPKSIKKNRFLSRIGSGFGDTSEFFILGLNAPLQAPSGSLYAV
jgi:hypothetical protein